VPSFKDDALLVAAHEQSRARGDEEPPEDEDDEDEDVEESFQPPARVADDQGFQGLLKDGVSRETLKEDCQLDEVLGSGPGEDDEG